MSRCFFKSEKPPKESRKGGWAGPGLASFHLQHLHMVLKDEEEHSDAGLQLDKKGQLQPKLGDF